MTATNDATNPPQAANAVSVGSTDLLGARYGAPKLPARKCLECNVPMVAHLWSQDADGDWWDTRCPHCGWIADIVCVMSPETKAIMSPNDRISDPAHKTP